MPQVSRVHELFILLFILLAITSASGQSRPSAAKPKAAPASSSSAEIGKTFSQLPVRRVVLYKNGVGYFEHLAKVRGNQEVGLDFTTAQLNDVLKSLTIVDTGEGHVASVRYNSVEPLDQRLRTLRLSLGATATRTDFLMALRGTRVEVKSGGMAFIGKLLSVERGTKTSANGETHDATELAVVSENGEMRSFEIGPSTSVRVVDGEVSSDVSRYLSLVGSSRGRDLRRMTIAAAGQAERELFVSYISEVPIWKSTYRIIRPTKPNGRTLLQGWAIVDNTVGEDWNNVELSLIAGAPQSFVQDLSQAYYVRRPVVGPPSAIELTPQTHEATLNLTPVPAMATVGSTSLQGTVLDPTGAVIPGAQVMARNEDSGASQSATTDSSGRYHFNNVPAGNTALFVSKAGFQKYQLSNFYVGIGRNNEINATLQVGSVSESVTVTASTLTLNTSSATVGEVEPEAEGRQAGDFFRYDLKQKITIGRNQSALVPILQAQVEAQSVTIWKPGEEPLRAIWMKNTSGLTLDGGSFEVLEQDAFSGEGITETIHPDERRLLSYAADRAVVVKADEQDQPERIRRIRIANGVMTSTGEERQEVKYVVRNSDVTPRDVVIEHPAEKGWKLGPGAKPEETTASLHRFVLHVDSGKTAELTVQQSHPEDTEFALTNVTADKLTELAGENSLTPELENRLKDVIAKKNAVKQVESGIKELEAESTSIANDQMRLRENMKALKGSAEERALVQRYTRQFNEEDRLATLKQEIASLKQQRDKQAAELNAMIRNIAFDQTF
jgi:hypothetical protein